MFVTAATAPQRRRADEKPCHTITLLSDQGTLHVRLPTPTQIRGARALLDWSMVDLARAAGVSVSTVKRMEMAEPQSLSAEMYATVQGAMEAAGVRFLSDMGEGIGLRLQP